MTSDGCIVMLFLSHQDAVQGIHGMLHALKHHQHAYIEDDRGFKMYVGPSTTGELLEVGVVTRGEHARIVHAMPARAAHAERSSPHAERSLEVD